ncbi:MAG: nitrilase family protein [Dehalococcoidia bacterium]
MVNGSAPAAANGRVPGAESTIKVAAIQTNPVVGDKDGNNARALELIHQAADQGVELMVLPELGNSGYIFNSRREVFELAEEIPSGPTVDMWARAARERGVYICGGICERDGDVAYNAAALVGPDGYIGRYRKVHLWDEEKLFFEPGNLGINVFDLPFGRVGIMICYDGWHPEVARILKLQGADIILDPTCWVLVPGLVNPDNPVSAYVHMAAAHVNNLYIVCADRCGVERGCTFLGRSCIAGPAGFVSGPGAVESEEIISAEINLSASRYHHWTALANPFADRRTDLFDKMLGYKTPPDRSDAYATADQRAATSLITAR